MSRYLTPFFRREERTLRIGLGVKGASQGEIRCPKFGGFLDSLLRRQGIPFEPFPVVGARMKRIAARIR
jgi:hypothetical protein